MRVLINHLTRMQAGYICVAGLDLATHQHIRPVLGGQLPADMLDSRNGPFNIGNVVELGYVRNVGHAPETEDRRFVRRDAIKQTTTSAADFWNALSAVAQRSFLTIFGPDFHAQGAGWAVDVGRGIASLGCIRPDAEPGFAIEHDKLRMRFSLGKCHCNLSVTDLRCYEEDHHTVRQAVVNDVAQRLHAGTAVILAVGLCRPWQKPTDTVRRHWLQLNNIHLADDPLWRD